MKKNRNKVLDIIKGIGIILIVIGHTGSPMTNFVYLFHLNLFIIIAGYLWKDEIVSDFQSLKLYIIKKIKRLYVPYVMCNGIAVILNNLFIDIGVYSLKNNHYFSTSETIIRLVKVFLFNNDTELFGAMWFLRLIFSISVTYAIISYCLKKIRIKKMLICKIIISISFMILGFWLTNNKIDLIIIDIPMFTCYIFFEIGRILNNIKNNIKDIYRIIIAILLFGILYILNNYGKIEISKNIYTNITFFFTVSILGWFFIYEIAYLISKTKLKYLSFIFSYLGENTMAIIKGQFIAFKILSLLISLIVYQTINFDRYNYNYVWILYTLFGIFIPILSDFIIKKIRERRKKNERNSIYNTNI